MFTWDPSKAASNLAKHGVSFEEASTVFADPNARIIEDLLHSAAELRWLLVGSSSDNRMLVVVYTVRRTNGTEITRIISARGANRRERKTNSRQ